MGKKFDFLNCLLRDITLTVASQFCLTCGVISACLITELGLDFFNSLRSCIVAIEYVRLSSVQGITSATIYMFSFIKLQMAVRPQ